MKRFLAAIVLAGILALGMPVWAGASPAVRMAYLQSDLHHLAFWVALEKGFFKQAGVPVEVAGVFKAGPEIMTAFAARELDMAYVGEAPATTAVANKTADVVVVAQVNTEGSALVVRKDSNLTAPADLAGKTVAVPGYSTVQDFLLKKALKNAGLKPDRVRIIVLKPPEMIPALRSHQIDAFIAWESYPAKAWTLGVGRNLLTSHDIWPEHPCCALVAGRRFLQAHRSRVEAVIRAHVQATRFIHAQPEEAVRIGMHYTGMDEQTVRRALKNVHYTYEPSIEGEKEYVRFLGDLRYIRVQSADYFVRRFIDPAPLRRVLEANP